MSEFTTGTVSVAGAPSITFEVRGDTIRAGLAGAKLYAEAHARDGGADLRVTDAAGEILASLIVNPRAHRNLTENVTDIGSALLWSHWRCVEAERTSKPIAELIAASSIGEGLRDIEERGIDAHLADPERKGLPQTARFKQGVGVVPSPRPTPPLCPSCLANRETVSRLRAGLREALDMVEEDVEIQRGPATSTERVRIAELRRLLG